MRLKVSVPAGRSDQRLYVLDVILREFLGIQFDLEVHADAVVVLSLPGHPGTIEMPDILLSVAPDLWARGGSLPVEPLARMQWPHSEEPLPLLYSDPNYAAGIQTVGDVVRIPFDLFGGCFYLLTRYEEIAAGEEVLDEHGRFPARASLLHRESLLERALLDEYLELLKQSIDLLWRGAPVQSDVYRLVLTHDVDHPISTVGEQLSLVLRRSAGDLVRRRDPRLMISRLHSYFSGDAQDDPNNTFAWLMDHSERLGVPSRFHFMAATKTRYDSGYNIGSPVLREVLKSVADRGHEIGLHPSYRTSRDPDLLVSEVQRLLAAVEKSGAKTWSKTSRQHYLRWCAKSTWSELSAAGIAEDSSVGFADAAGFRCGTSRKFSVYDWSSGQALQLKELPLIVMDVTLSGKSYLHLDWEQALQKAATIAAHCRRHRSPFTLLWHNDKVMSATDKAHYLALLEAIA